MTTGGPSVLSAILASVRRSLEVRRERQPLSVLARRAEEASPRGALFVQALSRPERLNVIAECKRRSPSRGILRAEYDAAQIAREYQAAGAAAVSVLTEPSFFDGSLEHLESVRKAVALPVLRKDFIVDEYQLFEARAAGADAVLLIVAALPPAALARLIGRAGELGLAQLVEAHERQEITVALEAGASVIGVNNRNLATLAVDPGASGRMAEAIPHEAVAVAESGLRTGEDLPRLKEAGFDAFLVGERLVTADRPGAALRELLTA